MDTVTDLGHVAFSPEGEEWIEFGAPGDRRRVGFHDYAELYSVPGLYDRVFVEELGMRSAQVVPDHYADALAQLGRAPAQERVLDLGAGSGAGGQRLRELGVGGLIGVDLEPAAAVAVERDRPGTYDEFHVADLSDAPDVLDALATADLTALVAVSAIGAGHIPLELLAGVAERVLKPGGLIAFAVDDRLADEFFAGFFARVDAERLSSLDYTHRRSTDGTPHRATVVAARLR